MDIFIKDENNNVLIGKVWPGETAFPDFFHPQAGDYWYNQISRFHQELKFDGMWIVSIHFELSIFFSFTIFGKTVLVTLADKYIGRKFSI